MTERDQLVAEGFLSDPNVLKAKELVLESIKKHSKKLTGIKPALGSKKQSYQETLDQFAKYRGGKLYFPYLGSGIGNGPLVELLDGSVKYDLINGIGVHFFGHSNPLLVGAAFDAALSDTIMEGNLQQNKDAMDLCEILVKASGLDHCFITSSGAMANENALKIAFQKKHPAYRILAFERCFMGRTLALSQATDKAAYRVGLPINLFIDYIPNFNPDKPEESIEAAKKTLKRYIKRYPKQHAIFCMELVQGEGGSHTSSKEYFRALMDIAKEEGILIFFDEIQTFGRLEKLFAFQHYGFEQYADIVSIGKLSQACATLFRQSLVPGVGLLSQTFTASTSAIRAAKTVVKTLLDGNFYGSEGKNAKIYQMFSSKLQELSQLYPKAIRGPFGIGSMIAFTVFDGDAAKSGKFVQDLFNLGVMGFVAGAEPTRIRFLVPAGGIELDQIDEVVKIIEEALKMNLS